MSEIKDRPLAWPRAQQRLFWGSLLLFVLFQALVGAGNEFLPQGYLPYLCVELTIFMAVTPGIILLIFCRKYLEQDRLKELWQESGGQTDVVLGVLKPVLSRLSLVLFFLYVFYALLFNLKRNGFSGVFSVYLVYPLCGLLIGLAVFVKKWVYQPDKAVLSFLTGVLDAGLCLMLAYLISYPFYNHSMGQLSGDPRNLFLNLFLCLPPFLFTWLKWRQTLRDLPERLFRKFDGNSFLEVSWLDYNRYYQKRLTPSRYARFAQGRWDGVWSREFAKVALLFLSICYATIYVGNLVYSRTHFENSGNISPAMMGTLRGLFGYSAFMGYSFLVPFLVASGIKRRGDSKKSVFGKGTFLKWVVGFCVSMTCFYLLLAVVGEVLLQGVFGVPYILGNSMEFQSFFQFLFLMILPMSLAVFLFASFFMGHLPSVVACWFMACIYMWAPLVQAGSPGEGIFFYHSHFFVSPLFCIYYCMAIFFMAFGFDWLGLLSVHGNSRVLERTIWFKLRSLYYCDDNPLVHNKGKWISSWFVMLMVLVYYLVLGVVCWNFGLLFGGMDPAVLLLIFAVAFCLWPAVCLVLFAPKGYRRENLEELWLTSLNQEDIVKGMLRRPLMIALCSSLLPYLVYCVYLLTSDYNVDEALTLFLVLPFAMLLFSSAVYIRCWLLYPQRKVRLFVAGTLEVFFYSILCILLVFLCAVMIERATEYFGYRVRKFWSQALLWIPPLVFAVLKWRQVMRNAPERLFHEIDEEAFLGKCWIAHEVTCWRQVKKRKRITVRQHRFLYPHIKHLWPGLVLLAVVLFCAAWIGSTQPMQASRLSRITSSSVTMGTDGILRALFGFSGYMGLSIMVPLVLFGGITGRNRRRKLPFYPGTLLYTFFRYSLMIFLFQAIWLLMERVFFKQLFFSERMFSPVFVVIQFFAFQLFLFWPVSFAVFLLMAPRQGRHLWGIVLWVVALILTCLPLTSMRTYAGFQNFNYPVENDLFSFLYYVYMFVAVYLVAFGFDRLGRRLYRLEIRK